MPVPGGTPPHAAHAHDHSIRLTLGAGTHAELAEPMTAIGV